MVRNLTSITILVIITTTLLMIGSVNLSDMGPITHMHKTEIGNPEFSLSQTASFSWTQYFGGSSADEDAHVSIDSQDNLIIFGKTKSDDLPITEGAFQQTYNGDGDGFIAKVSPEGELLFCTYLGGEAIEHVDDLTIDSQDNIIVVGRTDSLDFPVNSSIDNEYSGNGDGFVAKLSANGSLLLFSTFIGGNSEDWVHVVKINSNNDIIIAGHTATVELGIGTVYQPELNNGREGFIAKIHEDGSGFDFFTYFGGSSNDFVYALDLDSNENIIFAGVTYSENIPMVNPIQHEHAGGLEIYFAKLSIDASELLYSSFFGGQNNERPSSLVVDEEDNVIIVGDSNSEEFPVENGFQNEYGGSRDAVIMKISDQGSLLFSSYLGGSKSDRGFDVIVDNANSITLIGSTASPNFPATEMAIQPELGGNWDMFVSRISSDGSSLIYSTFLGGSNEDQGDSIIMYNDELFFVVGTTVAQNLDKVGQVSSSVVCFLLP